MYLEAQEHCEWSPTNPRYYSFGQHVKTMAVFGCCIELLWLCAGFLTSVILLRPSSLTAVPTASFVCLILVVAVGVVGLGRSRKWLLLPLVASQIALVILEIFGILALNLLAATAYHGSSPNSSSSSILSRQYLRLPLSPSASSALVFLLCLRLFWQMQLISWVMKCYLFIGHLLLHSDHHHDMRGLAPYRSGRRVHRFWFDHKRLYGLTEQSRTQRRPVDPTPLISDPMTVT